MLKHYVLLLIDLRSMFKYCCCKKNIISFVFEMVFLFMNATKEAKRKEKGLKKSLHFIDIQ